MALAPDCIIWTGKTVGITLECYKDNYTIKSVRSYESQGQTKMGYDWSFPQEYDKEQKAFKPREKAMPTSVFLGDKTKAIESLEWLLNQLKGQPKEADDIPF